MTDFYAKKLIVEQYENGYLTRVEAVLKLQDCGYTKEEAIKLINAAYENT